MSRPIDQEVFGSFFEDDTLTPSKVEWNQTIEVISDILDQTQSRCIGDTKVYGCTGPATMPLYVVPWYLLRSYGVPNEDRSSVDYWAPACTNCNILFMSMRFRVMSKWVHQVVIVKHRIYAKVRMEYAPAKDMLLNLLDEGNFVARANDRLILDQQRITSHSFVVGYPAPTIRGMITFIDTTGIKKEGKVVVLVVE